MLEHFLPKCIESLWEFFKEAFRHHNGLLGEGLSFYFFNSETDSWWSLRFVFHPWRCLDILCLRVTFCWIMKIWSVLLQSRFLNVRWIQVRGTVVVRSTLVLEVLRHRICQSPLLTRDTANLGIPSGWSCIWPHPGKGVVRVGFSTWRRNVEIDLDQPLRCKLSTRVGSHSCVESLAEGFFHLLIVSWVLALKEVVVFSSPCPDCMHFLLILFELWCPHLEWYSPPFLVYSQLQN